jgi:hypothetical protein
MAPKGPPPASANAIRGARAVLPFISGQCRGLAASTVLRCSKRHAASR